MNDEDKLRKSFAGAAKKTQLRADVPEHLQARVKELRDRATAEKARLRVAQENRRVDDMEKYVDVILRGESALKHNPPGRSTDHAVTGNLFGRADRMRRAANREELKAVDLRLENDTQVMIATNPVQSDEPRQHDDAVENEDSLLQPDDLMRAFARSAGNEHEHENDLER